MKKITILFVLWIVQYNASAQALFRVILKANVKVDSISIGDISKREMHHAFFKDTLIFKFDKQYADCYHIRCSTKGKVYGKQLWLDAGDVTVKAHIDATGLVVDTVLNSPVYYSVIDYLKEVKLFKDTLTRNRFMLAAIENNLETPRSLTIANDYINFNQNSIPNLLKLKRLLVKQKTDFSWFLFYTACINRMNQTLAIRNVDLAKFKFIDLKNKVTTVSLKNYNYYLLDFWFIGCVPCMRQHKQIKIAQHKIQDKRIAVIGICIDKMAAPWRKYLSQNGYTWANYLEAGNKTLSKYLAINAFPTYIVLNNKGDIVNSYSSIEDVFKGLKVN